MDNLLFIILNINKCQFIEIREREQNAPYLLEFYYKFVQSNFKSILIYIYLMRVAYSRTRSQTYIIKLDLACLMVKYKPDLQLD